MAINYIETKAAHYPYLALPHKTPAQHEIRSLRPEARECPVVFGFRFSTGEKFPKFSFPTLIKQHAFTKLGKTLRLWVRQNNREEINPKVYSWYIGLSCPRGRLYLDYANFNFN